MKQFQKFVIQKVVVPFAVVVFKIFGVTFRIKEINAAKMTPHQGKEKQYIYAFQHSQLLAHTYYYRDTKMASLASLSKDGEIAALAAEKFGITMVRGSSSRGGAQALRELTELAGRGFDIALTVDGPRGPLGTVNSGVIYLAELTGLEIIPCCFCCTKAVRLRSWDRFLIPLPFSRGYFNFGKPIKIPADLKDDGLEGYKNVIKNELERVNKECEEALK